MQRAAVERAEDEFNRLVETVPETIAEAQAEKL